MKESNNNSGTIAVLRELFGDNRAEWPSEHFKDIFVAPSYLKKLESVRPCILVGGRGTGKTTALQSLKYDSTNERLESNGQTFGDQEYLGVLVRMNKNRVHAFQGETISPDKWQKAFAHYFNLLVCLEMTKLAAWLESKSASILSSSLIKKISIDLGLPESENVSDLQESIDLGMSRLQIFVNNPSSESVTLSMAEVPVRTFAEALRESNLLDDRMIFCCVDEYENLLDYQQAVINTYIKHSEPPLSYKIGVRKNGLRNRQTLDGQDLLKTPDDYAEIEIAEEGFDFFAKAVADLRLKVAREKGVPVPESLNQFLRDLSVSEEAMVLGAQKVADEVLSELSLHNKDACDYMAMKPPHEIYFLRYWQEATGEEISALAKNWKENESAWETRLGNYGYSSLFWLSKGNKGVRIRKYYSGARVFLSLSAGNIRYFLELIDAAIKHQLESEGDFGATELTLSPKAQTLAARDVGKRRLNQLEGLADHGVQLKRLVLAIGKVFFEFARSPIGKTPETTSFVINGSSEDIKEIQTLLEEGVGHLAFEVAPRTKATSNLEIRDNEYRLHRIFCGFFEISHRKKRRITFEAKDLLSVLNEKPSQAISSLLEGRKQSREEDLPEQLAFFNAFYDSKEK